MFTFFTNIDLYDFWQSVARESSTVEVQSTESVIEKTLERSDGTQLKKFDEGISDGEIQKFMKFYLQLENKRRSLEGSRGSGGAPQYQNLSNVNIFNIFNSSHVGNLLTDPLHDSTSMSSNAIFNYFWTVQSPEIRNHLLST